MRRNHHKILLKPPKKKIPLLIKCAIVGAAILLGLWWLNYFIASNDLVNQPYFPSPLSLYTHQSIAWISVLVIGIVFLVIFMSASYEWILNYRRQKFTQYILATFLCISGICLATFFGSVTKDMVYTALNAMSSQLALQLGSSTTKRAFISETHSANPLFQQELQVRRGKVMARIIDPVSYRFNLQLTFDGKHHTLDPYCYCGSEDQPILKTPRFKIIGIESFLGFRCTSGCELYKYFQVQHKPNLTSFNFSSCRKIYIQQPSLK